MKDQAAPEREATPTRDVAREAIAAPMSAPARSAGPSPAQALHLQRTAGNRAAGRVLSRWIKHPDDKKKGEMMSDEAAEMYNHFNIPQNK
jgi:hypothetical protein